MNRESFMHRLAEVIRPRSAQAGATMLVKMLGMMTDLHDDLFTEESLAFIAPRLPRSPNIGQLRDAFAAYTRTTAPKPEHVMSRLRREEAERDAFLHRDWDDPAGILRKIANVQSGPETQTTKRKWLRVLALTVGRYAPQHLGCLPPAILQSLMDDPEIIVPWVAELRSRALYAAPQRDRQEQLEALHLPAPAPRFAQLTPEQLRAFNPARRQADASISALSQQQAATGGRATTTEAMDGDEGRYPARDE